MLGFFLTEEEVQRIACPPYHSIPLLYTTLYSPHQIFNVPWTGLASLHFHASVYIASSSWDVFILSSKLYSLQKDQSVTSFCKAFALSTCGEGKDGFHNTLYLYWLYFFPHWGTFVCLPLNLAPWGQKLGLLYLYAWVPSSGITPERGAFSPPLTEWCTVRLLILRWRNEIMFLISNVSWKFTAATGISRKQNTHSLKAVRAVFW